jgi:orotate phosphoribosyltransferase
MKTKFTFVECAEMTTERVGSRISGVGVQGKYMSDKILQGPRGLVRVLNFIGAEDKGIGAEHLGGILIESNTKYRRRTGSNLPLVISNIHNEGLSALQEANELVRHIEQDKWLIPVVDNYGRLVTILGVSDEAEETLKGCLQERCAGRVRTHRRHRHVGEEMITSNKWLCRQDKGSYHTSFSIAELVSDMTMHMIKDNLEAIQEGHFELLSGNHVLEHISGAALFSRPKLTEWMARLVYARFERKLIDCIVTYSNQTYTFALTLEEEFQKKGVTTECLMMEDYNNPHLKHSPPYYKKFKDRKALVITDVSGTGQLLERIANVIKLEGGRVQGLSTIVETNPYKGHFKRHFFSLCKYKVDQYSPASCPACKGPNSLPPYYINPRTNTPFLSSSSRQEFESITSGNEENKEFWDMVRKTDALKTHVLLGEGRRHYYYYIDTYAILSRYIKEIKWNMKCIYGKKPPPDIILFPSNQSAVMIAKHLKHTEFPNASLLPADKTGDEYNVGNSDRMMEKNILIVDDGANTGRTLCGLLNLCMRVNGSIDNVRACIFVDRLIGEYRNTVVGKIAEENIRSIYRIPIPSYIDETENCPLCIEVAQLKKHYQFMSFAAQTYVDNRLAKIRAKEMQEEQDRQKPGNRESPESTISRAKTLDFLYGKGETAFLEALKYKTSPAKLVRVLEAIPSQYVTMTDIKPWMESQLSNIKDIGYLTKSLRMWLNADLGTIVKHLPYVIEQFAKAGRNRFLAYLLGYIVCQEVVSREDLTVYLTNSLKRLPEHTSFLRGIVNSVIFEYPDKIRLRPSLMSMYDDTILKAARTDINVLITGETGAGKGVLAKIIHDMSRRKDKPLRRISVSMLSPTVLESELFGHEKGAFTDAIQQKRGQLELADGGTAFFDEIGDIALHLQVKLLDVIEEKEFQRVGGTESIKVDFRLICATNKPLEEMLEKGRFRLDLFQRISGIHIHVPPLREHPDDITKLATYFFDLYCREYAKEPVKYDEEIDEMLKQHPWPGNVRDLKTVVERAVVLSEDGRVDVDRMRTELAKSPMAELSRGTLSFKDLGREMKARRVAWALEKTRGNKTKAAMLIGVSRKTLYTYLH